MIKVDKRTILTGALLFFVPAAVLVLGGRKTAYASSLTSVPGAEEYLLESEDVFDGDEQAAYGNGAQDASDSDEQASFEADGPDREVLVEKCKALKGVWDGVYFNSAGTNGKMKLQLTIEEIYTDGYCTATFAFSEHPENPDTAHGSYTMRGNYDFTNDKLNLRKDAWVERPDNWNMLDVSAVVDIAAKTMTGSTESYNGLQLSKTTDTLWLDATDAEQSGLLLGTWTGHYFQHQGKTALSLTILDLGADGTVSARFDFSEHPDNPGVPTGSYTMTGTYDFDARALNLDGVEWLLHPNGYFMVSVQGRIDVGHRVMTGTTNGSSGTYGGLYLTRDGVNEEVYKITAQSSEGGTIDPAAGAFAPKGSERTFTILPDDGYLISKVTVDGTDVGAISTYTFKNITADHTIEAVFAKPESGVAVCNDNDEISINYSGYAVSRVHLAGVQSGDEVTYTTASGDKKVRVDKDGCVSVQSDLYKYNAGGSNAHRFETKVKNAAGKELAIVCINRINVKDISFAQKWNAKVDAGGTAKIGASVGAAVGPAEAEASLANAKATGSVAATMELKHSYKEGKRNLDISQKYDARVAVKGSAGPGAEALNDAVEIKAIEVSGTVGVGQQVSSGIKIKDYDASDVENAKKIGKFVLMGAAESSGNVYLMRALELLGYKGASDSVGTKVTIDGKAGLDFLKASAKGPGIEAEASVMSGEIGGVLSYEAVRDRSDKAGPVYTKKRNWANNGSVNFFAVSATAFKDSPVNIDTGFHGAFMEREHIFDTSVSGRIESLYDTSKSKDNITKIAYGANVYQDNAICQGGMGGADVYDNDCEIYHEIVYADADAQTVAKAVPAVGKFYDYFITGFSDKDIKAIEQCSAARATFSDTYKEKTTIDVPLKLGLEAGVGLEVGVGLKGVYEESYDIDGGTYDYDEDKGERYEVKTNVCESKDVEEKIKASKQDILTLLTEPVAAVVNSVKNFITDAACKAGEAIENGLAKIKNKTKDKVAHVMSLAEAAADLFKEEGTSGFSEAGFSEAGDADVFSGDGTSVDGSYFDVDGYSAVNGTSVDGSCFDVDGYSAVNGTSVDGSYSDVYGVSDAGSYSGVGVGPTSYQICVYDSEDTFDSGDSGKVSVTVGEPYIVYLTDKNGKRVTDWGKKDIVTLELGYNDEVLSAAGLTDAAAASLAIYRYSRDKLGYIYEGGTVDTAKKCVTLDINKEGQYILAVDNTPPVVTEFTTEGDGNPPVIIARIDEMSGFGELSLKLDDKEVVNLKNLDKYYDVGSGVIRYQPDDILSEGTHRVSIFAADAAGNAMSAAAELEFNVTTPMDERVLAVGAKKKLTASFKVKKWTTSSKKKATVSKSGKVKAKKPGTVTITAIEKGGSRTETWQFIIEKPKLSVGTLKSADSFNINSKITGTTYLTPKSYKSSKPDVLSIASDGTVTVGKNGKAKITITYANGKVTKTVKVKIRK